MHALEIHKMIMRLKKSRYKKFQHWVFKGKNIWD